MSLQVETLEKNMAKLTVEVPAQELDAAMQKVYVRTKSRITIPGFRKGKAPRKMIERIYGAGVFLEDAVNDLVPQAYNKVLDECELEIVSQPKFDLVQLEPGKDLIFTAEVATRPPVTLGEYKGLEVPASDLNVSDEEVDAEIGREQEKNARTVTVEDRPAQEGDIVTLDYEGSTDGVPFDGGSAKDHKLTLGSKSFIPGFEDQLVGAKAGDHVEVSVTFPEEYHAKELAGKPAVFQCEIHKIEVKELPELDDEFAQDVSDAETFEEYKEQVRKKLEEGKASRARMAKENAAVEKAVENAQMEIPDAMVETQAENMINDMASRMRMQGMSLDQYFQYTGQNMQALLEDTKPGALQQIKTRLVLEEVVKQENITVTEEDINEELEKTAKTYSMEIEKLRESLDDTTMERMKKDLSVQKAISLIADAAVEK